MSQTISIAPPNSLIFICDAAGGSVPDPDGIAREAGITATDSCVVVCCLAEMDGKTEVTMGLAGEVDPGEKPGFDGALATPTRTAAVSTVAWNTLFETNVPTSQTWLRIWTNRPKKPDKVVVGIG